MALSSLRNDGFFSIGTTSRAPDVSRPGANQNSQPQTNANIRNAGQAMSSAIGVISGRNTGALQGNTANAEVATVQVDNKRTIASMPPRDTSVQVQQLARGQQNQGDALTASSRNVTAGEHTFSIEANGKTHEFTINVSADDTNGSIQRMMANTINASDIGVTAAVRTGTEDGATTSTLTLTGTQTGAGNNFTVTGDIAQSMGVTDTTRAAQNAVYSLNNGETLTSQTNDINIAAGVNITLTGEGSTNITFGRTAEQAVSATRDLVSAINSAIRSTNPNDGRGSSRFINDLIGMNVTFTDSLARVGINVQNNGQLSIDEDRLRAAAADGSLERLDGFTRRAGNIASNAATRHYANAAPPVNVSTNNFNFGNTANLWSSFNMFV
jgi:hypothetical protein